MSLNVNMKLPKIPQNIILSADPKVQEDHSPTKINNRETHARLIALVNDTLQEEIQEEILCSPKAKQYDLFDPFSGEKVQVRKKVLCTIDVQPIV